MPPALDHPCLDLILLEQTFITYKLPADAEIPENILSAITSPASNKQLVSLSRTPEETSLVCAVDDIALAEPDIPKWRCIRIRGPMEFGTCGP